MDDVTEGTQQLLVSQLDEAPGLSYILSTSIESNSRGYTTSVKSHVEVHALPGETDADAIERGRQANAVLLAAGQTNIVFRRIAIETQSRQPSSDEASAAYTDYLNLLESFRRFVGVKLSGVRPTDV